MYPCFCRVTCTTGHSIANSRHNGSTTKHNGSTTGAREGTRQHVHASPLHFAAVHPPPRFLVCGKLSGVVSGPWVAITGVAWETYGLCYSPRANLGSVVRGEGILLRPCPWVGTENHPTCHFCVEEAAAVPPGCATPGLLLWCS